MAQTSVRRKLALADLSSTRPGDGFNPWRIRLRGFGKTSGGWRSARSNHVAQFSSSKNRVINPRVDTVSFRQCKSNDILPRSDGDVLFVIEHIRHRRSLPNLVR